MVLLFLCLGHIRLEAYVFKPVCMSQLNFDLIQTEELDRLDLSNQILLAKCFIARRTLRIFPALIFCLAQLSLVA